MNTNIWYVIIYTNKVGRKVASMVHLNGYLNIAAYVRDFPGLISMNACKTKKDAFRIFTNWNKQFEQNEKYRICSATNGQYFVTNGAYEDREYFCGYDFMGSVNWEKQPDGKYAFSKEEAMDIIRDLYAAE